MRALATLRDEQLGEARAYVHAIAAKAAPSTGASPAPFATKVLTFSGFASRWTSGELRRDYPDHVEDLSAEVQADYDRSSGA